MVHPTLRASLEPDTVLESPFKCFGMKLFDVPGRDGLGSEAAVTADEACRELRSLGGVHKY